MQVEKNKVVKIDYKLTDDEGRTIDSSEGQEPLSYLHGQGNIIPGLERELDGKQVGAQLQVAVQAKDGYGERNEQLTQQVPREQFAQVPDLQVGMQFQVQSENGPLMMTIVDIQENVVVVDGNHPLAGVNLNFDVTVRDIRNATEEELAHGHAHGPGGHEHE